MVAKATRSEAGIRGARSARITAAAAPFLVATVLLLAGAPVAGADVSQSVTLEANHSVARGADDEALAAGTGLAELDLRSTGSRYVRGRLQLRARVQTQDPTADLEVPRAFVKARFPLNEASFFHVTAGRTRLTWGDGAFFNAGDTLFGTLGENPDFTQETIRDETAWLASAFFPLGRFSFVEPVVLVPLPDDGAEGAVEPSPAHDTAAGLRVQGKIAQVKTEASYLFRGEESYHQPAVSIQGNLGLDYYAGATTRLPGPDSKLPWKDAAEAAREEAALSAGLLHIAEGTSGQSLTLRLEGLVRPWREWSEQEGSSDGGSGDALAAHGPASSYALELFPEVIWQPAVSLQFFFRSMVSPVDASALFVPGASWSPYDALTLSVFGALQAGEVDDVYGWERPGGASLSATVRYVY